MHQVLVIPTHLIISVPFFNLLNKSHKSSLKTNPPKGNFDIDAGDGCVGVGWDHLAPPQITNYFVRELFTLLGHCSKHVKNISLKYVNIYENK